MIFLHEVEKKIKMRSKKYDTA